MEHEEFLNLLEQSQKNHLEICACISLLKHENERKSGMSLRTLKAFRALTLDACKFDLKVRAASNAKSKQTLQRNKITRKSPTKSANSCIEG